MAKKFSELRAKMSPVAKEHSDEEFHRLVEELRRAADVDDPPSDYDETV